MKNVTKKVKLLIMGLAICMTATVFYKTEVAAATLKPTRWNSIANSSYTSTQGMCMDDKGNVYVAQLNSNSKVAIYKYDKNKKKTKVIDRVTALGHANDMTYCPKNGYLYVVTGGDKNTEQTYDVIAFDTNKKDSNGELKVVGKYMVWQLSSYASGIAYSSKYDVFYIKKAETIYVGNFKNGEFDSINSFKLDYGTHDGYVNQGIAAKGENIYIPLWDSNGQKNSVVRVYKVSKNSKGKYSNTYKHSYRYDDNTAVKNSYEMEGVDFYSGKMYFSTNGSGNDDAIFYTSTY